MAKQNDYNRFAIPVFITNPPDDEQGLAHIHEQFSGKEEFDLTIYRELSNPKSETCLWKNICHIIRIAIQNENDVIILADSLHQFTPDYDKHVMFESVIRAAGIGSSLVLCGVKEFAQAVPLTKRLHWVDHFSGFTFMVLFRDLFDRILKEPIETKGDTSKILSCMTSRKMMIYPMFSTQKHIKNVDLSENLKILAENAFDHVMEKLKKIQLVKDLYCEDIPH